MPETTFLKAPAFLQSLGPFFVARCDYVAGMLKLFDFCIPTRGTKVPDGPDWLHEIKYDGYRLRLERDGGRVRLISRNGYNWTDRYPWIVEAALKNRMKQFVVDGEAVALGLDGIADFNALHSRKHDDEVQLYAFEMLAGDGDDMRALPLSMRKTNLARLLARRPDGIFVAPFEQGEIGPDLFRAACKLGLEGIVSKRRDRPYRAGRSPHWLKIKDPASPAMTRVEDGGRGEPRSRLRRSGLSGARGGKNLLAIRKIGALKFFPLGARAPHLGRCSMDYRGKTYTVLQGVERASWKWTVHLDEITVKSGSAPTREAAKIKAIWIIEKARAPKENENTRRNEIKRDADTLASLPVPEQQLLSSAVPLSNKGHDPRPKNHPRRDA